MKWFHVIGVCGKTTSNIAKEFKSKGWFTTGTDLNFFEPAASIIKNNNINFENSYHFSHLTRAFWENKIGKNLEIGENPDLVMFVESITNRNKEYLFAKNKNLKLLPYSKIFEEMLVKQNSIVVSGTAGKTTTTSLITKVLKDLDLNPSYMIGADVKDFENSLEIHNSDWSILEGDEYYNPNLTEGPKFWFYNPKYLIITNIGFEHKDIYKTQDEYINVFKKLVEKVPEDGLILINAEDKNIEEIINFSKAKVIKYSSNPNSNKADFKIRRNKSDYQILSDDGQIIFTGQNKYLLGDYNFENILAAVLLCLNSPIKNQLDIQTNYRFLEDSIANFKGPKKRLEIKYKTEDLIIVDDFGVAPERAKNSLETLHKEFSDYGITAVFEPNSASRLLNPSEFSSVYKNVFNLAHEVIIPSLSTFNTELLDSRKMMISLTEMDYNSSFVPDEKIIDYLVSKIDQNGKNLIVFFSSYKLTKVVDDLVSSFTKISQ